MDVARDFGSGADEHLVRACRRAVRRCRYAEWSVGLSVKFDHAYTSALTVTSLTSATLVSNNAVYLLLVVII